MSFNAQQILRYFNAGIATVAIDSPTASELALETALATRIARNRFEFYLWDAGSSLRKIEWQTCQGQTTLRKIPVSSYRPSGHPVEALFEYVRAVVADRQAPPALFLLKDLYPYIAGVNPNPALVRRAIDTWFALKRSPHRALLLHDGLQTPKAFQDLVADTIHSLPTESDTEEILAYRSNALAQSAAASGADFRVELDESARKRIVRALLGMSAEGMDDALQLVAIGNGGFNRESATAIAEIKRAKFAARGIQFANPPDVAVQGLPRLQAWASTMAALLEPEAQERYNLPFPKGALIVGVGGTGKTLSVKCFAREWGLPVIALDVGSLMTKALGGSEANLRDAIAAAEACAPAILFIDEMDKMFPGGHSGESDGGTSQRMLGYFLKWFAEGQANVFVAATANRPGNFKPELLRRFTKVFYVDLPAREAREQIWRVQLARYHLHLADDAIDRLARESDRFTGDEIRKIAEHCACVAYAEGRPTRASLEELLSQIRAKPPQFSGDTAELDALRAWARSGQATWAAPEISSSRDSLDRDRAVEWNAAV